MVLSSIGREGEILDDFSHSIHLHGHSFYVVHVEHGTYENGVFHNNTKKIECKDLQCSWTNGIAPDFSRYATDGRLNDTAIRKDTVIVPAGGYVVIAFQADNPGYWFMHCHMEVHQLEGMAVIIQEYPENQHQPPPYGINNVGNFFWPQEPTTKNWWMIGLIIAVAVLSAVILLLVIIIVAICCKLKNKNSKPDNPGGKTPLLK